MENTIARIVSKKRLMADKIESSASAHGGPNQFQAELIKDLREEADEIEEAHQREMEAHGIQMGQLARKEAMNIDKMIHGAMCGLARGVLWRETAFADVQWYYAESRLYVIRIKHGQPNEHLRLIKASCPDEAISRAVFDMKCEDDA